MKNDSPNLPENYLLKSGNLSLWLRKGFCELDFAIRIAYGEDLYPHTSCMKADNITLTSSSTRSKKAEEIYEKAKKAIKSRHLRARKVDQRDSQGGEFVAVRFVSKDHGEQTWSINPKVHGFEMLIIDFLQWAFIEKFAIPERTSQLLGLSKRFGGKFHFKTVVWQAIAQVIWHYEPSMSISGLANHWLIEKVCKKHYDKKNSFRDIVKSVDPRPESDRRKPKSTMPSAPIHYPPKLIPGILLTDQTRDFIALKTACKALFNALKLYDPSLQSSSLVLHPLVELYLGGVNEIIRDMSLDWLAEVETKFPLSLDSFK